MAAEVPPVPTLLLTFTGRDRPGVTTELFGSLEPFGVDVLDIEQVVVHGRLILAVLVTRPPGASAEAAAIAAVQQTATSLGMECEAVATTGDSHRRPRDRAHVTVIGQPLSAGAVARVAARIAEGGGNIDRILRIARYPVSAIELQVSGAKPDVLRDVLAREATASRLDIAVQRAGLQRRAKRLVVMDVDSTLIQDEVIELLAAHAGHAEQVAAITAAAMNGELDFAESLHERVALLAGMDAKVLDEVRREVTFAPGARTLCRTLSRLGYQLAIVSGGFSQITDSLAEELGIHFSAANELEINDGKLTGRIVGDIVDRQGKARALERFAAAAAVPLSQVVAIGDGANDLDMIARAGLGIAFNAKPTLRAAADATVNVPYLDAIMYLLGITREEIEAADEEAGTPTPAPPVP
jgi:phosphoserine phosphatase